MQGERGGEIPTNLKRRPLSNSTEFYSFSFDLSCIAETFILQMRFRVLVRTAQSSEQGKDAVQIEFEFANDVCLSNKNRLDYIIELIFDIGKDYSIDYMLKLILCL
ncbi:hypothetical protein JTE90_004663 [Oedothorax gibbosus]|uniref:Uncharacterized protein n=1 Tax=Oedothorax gibbosus TaxID=931172 RepID=A0AAV6UYD3_9ARAC|nr:hypothetical protein JTE90_004663 [Oedothorax gibbosus]